VRTDPDAPKHAGITTMVIDMHAPGVEVRPCARSPGNSDFNEVFFNDVFVPDDDVVGTPNDGWTVARSTLGNERVSIGGGFGGIFPGMDLFDLLRRHGDRVPGAAARVGGILTKDHALKVLNLRRAQRAVIGSGPGPEGNVTKLVLAEHGHRRAAAAGRSGGERRGLPRRGRRFRRLPNWPPAPCRSPAGRRRSRAIRSPSASSDCPGTPSGGVLSQRLLGRRDHEVGGDHARTGDDRASRGHPEGGGGGRTDHQEGQRRPPQQVPL
jgi:hypothetical protein